MRMSTLVPLGFLVLLAPHPAGSQYLYLDTNGDGIHDQNDRLAPSGPTAVDVWFVTDKNRDGTPVVCDAEAGVGMTMNSYTFVLHAAGGDVRWGPMQNRIRFVNTPVCFATYEDTTGASYYHNGWGSWDIFPPGAYRVATLAIEVTSGDPSIFIEPFLPQRPVQLTQFGTKCPARDDDNTYKLGYDWSDADGIGPMRAEAGGPYHVQAGRTLTVTGAESRTTNGQPLGYSWDFGDGATGTGETASHVYAEPGDYALVLTARSGDESDTDTTLVHVVPAHAPIAILDSRSTGYVHVPLTLDGRGSVDPDGDPIVHSWSFGDGGRADGALVTHTYGSAGVFTARLTVSDGLGSDTASQEVTIEANPHPPTAVAGGPYAGIIGRVIQFNGTASSDPDGDPLVYTWGFGDQGTGIGVITGHAYQAAGTYSVRLTVSDGFLSNSSSTSAVVTESLPARAFGNTPIPVVTLAGNEPLTLHVEADHGSFRLEDVELWPITMRSSGTGSTGEIASVENAAITHDLDQNGAPELTFTFSADELALLFANVEHPAVVTVTIGGSFYAGGSFAAEMRLLVRREGGEAGPLRVAPNPFNPDAVVTFSTSKPGPVRAHLYDVHGRMVRTVLRNETMAAGPHALALSARGDDGTTLASGIYFFRLIGPDGVTAKRVAVAK